MLSVPTLWTVFVVNFLATGLIWAYVMRAYPKLEAARFWTASSITAASGAAVAMLRVEFDSMVPLIVAGTVINFAVCLATMGIERFFDRPVSWRAAAVIVGLTCTGLSFFTYAYESAPTRVLIYSLGQGLPFALSLKLLFSPQEGRVSPGARLSGIVACVVLAIYAVRVGGHLVGVDFTFTSYSAPQSVVVLLLMFLAMAFNFGFLLMAMDRLRKEVADLALLDDLTGVGNRRHLMQRLTEECARSERSGKPFALLVIDLDGFKTINDTHGHAAGDACLQHFALMAQTRLRPGDLLARSGGDEFCIVLPSSTLREGAMIARRVLEVCRQDAEACSGADNPIAVSIGVAQWNDDVGNFPDRLMAHADQALYAAKKGGKNRLAAHDPALAAPPLVPADEMVEMPALRQRA